MGWHRDAPANAVKFVPRGVKPRVYIESETEDGLVRLWFEDNGIGIEPAAQVRILKCSNGIIMKRSTKARALA